jgi:hypothetical protein
MQDATEEVEFKVRVWSDFKNYHIDIDFYVLFIKGNTPPEFETVLSDSDKVMSVVVPVSIEMVVEDDVPVFKSPKVID